jgi:hypothetical protein
VTIQVEIKKQIPARCRTTPRENDHLGHREGRVPPSKSKGTAPERRRMAGRDLFVVLDERKDIEAGELGAAV